MSILHPRLHTFAGVFAHHLVTLYSLVWYSYNDVVFGDLYVGECIPIVQNILLTR